jgi:PelA/Pel-15E family pectate lyase
MLASSRVLDESPRGQTSQASNSVFRSHSAGRRAFLAGFEQQAPAPPASSRGSCRLTLPSICSSEICRSRRAGAPAARPASPCRAAAIFGLSLACALGCADSGGDGPDGSRAGSTSVGGSTATGGSGGSGGSAGGSTTGGSATGDSGGAGIGGATAGSGGAGPSTGGSDSTGGTPAAGGGAGAGGGVGGSSGGAAGATAGASSSSGGAAGAAAGAGGSAGDPGAVILDQTDNFVYDQLENYKSWLSTANGDAPKLTADRTRADNMLTWQMPHGGFDKNGDTRYGAPWNGSDPRAGWTGAGGVELGTIDNDATVTEIMFLADVYQRAGAAAYRDGARKALEFLLTMQYDSGGFPQVYPERPDSYSNYVTFNDNAMVRALVLLLQITKLAPPLQGDLFTTQQRADAATAITKAVGYILAAQIEQDGVKTVWCAQHDPVTHVARGARSYELPSKSGSESVGVVGFLMTQPQTTEVAAAVHAAIAWYESADVQLENTAYVSRPSGSTDDNYNPIQARSGSTMWCRFYDLAEDTCFFSGRLASDNPPGEGKQYDIMDIEPERRYGYQWGGSYGTRLFAYTDSVGY